MNEHETHLASLDVDDAWIVCWAEQGILALEASLAKHAAFQAYPQVMDGLDTTDGDALTDA
ncbi:MAG: hypothetical protein ACXWZB_00645 [Gaiellaceae bacterium]